MAALTTALAIAGGALAGKLLHHGGTSAAPQVPTMPAAPDPAVLQMQQQQAAQRAAAYARLRANSTPSMGSTFLTGPAGIPSPAPVQRNALIGQ